MKKISGILMVLVFSLLTGCEGIPGPPGRDGLDGEDGESFLGSVFEIERDFTSENDYQAFFEFPNTIEVFESDVVLVYILWEQAEDQNGDPLDVWRLLPQSVVLGDEILQYNYDYTFADVRLFLEGSIDFGTLNAAEALNQIFRVVVFPAAMVKNNQVDLSNFNSVMQGLKIHPGSIERMEAASPGE